MTIPQHSGFALIGDGDCRDAVGRCGRSQYVFEDPQLGLPDFKRVMFNPTGLWKNLFEFALSGAHALALRIEQNRARACGALIECEDVGHRSYLLSLNITRHPEAAIARRG